MNNEMWQIIYLILFSFITIKINAEKCKPSITTASGFKAPHKICSGQLIFDEHFNKLDKRIWTPDVNFWGGGVSCTY